MPLDTSVFDKYRDFMGEDTDAFIIDIIQTFLTSAPKALENMQTLLASGQRQDFIRAAHTLKSNSATVGTSELSQLCETMELQGGTLDVMELQKLLAQANHEYKQAELELQNLLSS
jgi:HPt (histidine-containing phosphotransfer) domain-containing protein